jgi:hypothetical protein
MQKSKAPSGSGFMPGGLHVPQNDSDEQHSKHFSPVGSKSDLRKHQDEIWHAQFLLLRSFQQASGCADIKKSQDKQLVRWIVYQKSRYKNGKLPKDRQKMLEDVGINLQETSFLHSANDTSPNALSNRSNVDSKTGKEDAREAREEDTGTGNEKDVRRAGTVEKVQNSIYDGASPQYETCTMRCLECTRKLRDLRFCVLNGHEPRSVQRLLSTLSSSGGVEAQGEDARDGQPQVAREAGGIGGCKRGASEMQHRLQERRMQKSKAPSKAF